jgi:hypothetical protein
MVVLHLGGQAEEEHGHEGGARAGIFKESIGAKGTEDEEGYRTGPPGYIGWRNSFLGIDSGAPYTFKNSGSAGLSSVGNRAFICRLRSVGFMLPSS